MRYLGGGDSADRPLGRIAIARLTDRRSARFDAGWALLTTGHWPKVRPHSEAGKPVKGVPTQPGSHPIAAGASKGVNVTQRTTAHGQGTSAYQEETTAFSPKSLRQ